MTDTSLSPNDWSHAAWEANAAFWDERMGEGNDFVEVLVWPAVTRLLDVRPGQRILDVACGNGLTSRRMAKLGAQVLAVDFSAELLRFAAARSQNYGGQIEYRRVDATDEAALLDLGAGSFDAVLCNMALFDMAEFRPLTRAAFRLLRPGGCFVYSIVHPSFNSSHLKKVAEEEDTAEGVVTRFAIKVYTYMTPETIPGHAMAEQPLAQPYFHRPLSDYLAAAFEAGFVVDGFEERAFPPGQPDRPRSMLLSWGSRFSEFPPVLVVRLRRPA